MGVQQDSAPVVDAQQAVPNNLVLAEAVMKGTQLSPVLGVDVAICLC